MNILAARVAFRERPLVDVIDLSLRFVVVHARDYGKVALATLLPAFLASWAAARLGGWALGWVVGLALASLATTPFTILASRLVFEEVPRTRDVLAAAARSLPAIVAVRLLSLLAILLGLLVLVVPAVWFGAVVFFVDEVTLLERAKLTPAFARAQRLATGSLGTALMAHLLFLVLRASAVALADVAGRAVIGELLQFRPPESAFSAGGSVLCLAGLFLTVPFFATGRFFAYLDVRTRSEGWDIQTRFAALAARAAADTRAVEVG